MRRKDKNHHGNIRFMPFFVGLGSVCLLVAGSATAGPTTGQLQQQIDELAAQLDRLRPLIEDPCARSYTAGLAAVSQIEDCMLAEDGLGCFDDPTLAILIDVHEGQQVRIDVIDALPESVTYNIEKLPAANPLSSRDYHINVNAVKSSDTFDFSVSPEEPIYSSEEDPCYPASMPPVRCELATDWRIRIITPGATVRQTRTESNGVIVEAYIEPYPESATETELKVTFGNFGGLRTVYIVTATGFGPSIEPVAAQSVTLYPRQQGTLTFPIRTVDNFTGQGPGQVMIKSHQGKLYDEPIPVDFPAPLPDGPAPEYIPDFDGDGDCDLDDFRYFSLFWLEQPDN